MIIDCLWNQPKSLAIFLITRISIFALAVAFSVGLCVFSCADDQDVAPLPVDDTAAPVQKIRVPVGDLEKLPLLATVDLVSFPSTIDIELPKTFVGNELLGVVKLKNCGNADLKIDRIKTSCGCAVAQSEKREVVVGGSTLLLVKFAFRQSGVFRNSVLISFDLGEVMIRVRANVDNRIAVTRLIYEIAETENSIPIFVDINDPVLLDTQLTVTPSTGTIKIADWEDSVKANRLRYDLFLDERTLFPTAVSLTFVSGGKTVDHLQIRVDEHGSIRLSLVHVYAKRPVDNDDLRFRLILTGATDDLAQSKSGTLCFLNGAPEASICSKAVEVTSRKLNQSLILTVVVPNDEEVRTLPLLGQPCRLTVGGVKLKFDLTIR